MGSWWSLKSLCGRVVVLFSICILVVIFLENRGVVTEAAAQPEVAAAGNSRHLDVGGRDWHVGRLRSSHLFYVSKRRVPNGADPIHNRRAGKSGRPPGRV